MKLEEIRNQVLDHLSTIDRISATSINSYADLPNKYGSNILGLSSKYDVKDRWNYRRFEMTLDYTAGTIFVPLKGVVFCGEITKDVVINVIDDFFKSNKQ